MREFDNLRSSAENGRTLTASVHSVGCSGLRTISIRGFRLSSGEGNDVAGFDLGPSPEEHLLGAIGAILARSTVAVACQRGLDLDRFDLKLTALIPESRGPLIFDSVHVVIRIESACEAPAFVGLEGELLAHSAIDSWFNRPILLDLNVHPVDPARISADDWVI